MPQRGQWEVSLRLGMATNGPLVPSMIFRSRTTKQSSKVIEQNALSRSPGSSMSLMRTSVISTAVLLAKLQVLAATAGDVDESKLPRFEDRGQPPRMLCVATNAKVSGSAAR